LLIKRGETFIPIEIKKAANFSRDFTKGLNYWNRLPRNVPQNAHTAAPADSIIVYTGETELSGNAFKLTNWQNVNRLLW
jgi:hypothetical protein